MKKRLFTEFNKVYKSSLGTSRLVSQELNAYWLKMGIANELISQLELCVVEMVNNAFIHAYKKKLGLPVELKCSINF